MLPAAQYIKIGGNTGNEKRRENNRTKNKNGNGAKTVELEASLDEVANTQRRYERLTEVTNKLTEYPQGRHAVFQLHDDMRRNGGKQNYPPLSWRR